MTIVSARNVAGFLIVVFILVVFFRLVMGLVVFAFFACLAAALSLIDYILIKGGLPLLPTVGHLGGLEWTAYQIIVLICAAVWIIIDGGLAIYCLIFGAGLAVELATDL